MAEGAIKEEEEDGKDVLVDLVELVMWWRCWFIAGRLACLPA